MVGQFDKDFDMLIAFMKSGVEDRTLAIICCSYCEKYVAELIQYRMPGLTRKLTDKLFKPDGLLGPAIARTDIALALGSMDKDSHADLKTMISIRNQFAHNLEISSFDHVEIAKRVKNLKIYPHHPNDTKPLSGWDARGNRDRFAFVGTSLAMSLHNSLNSVAKIEQRS